jgi:hypothetical protein
LRGLALGYTTPHPSGVVFLLGIFIEYENGPGFVGDFLLEIVD